MQFVEKVLSLLADPFNPFVLIGWVAVQGALLAAFSRRSVESSAQRSGASRRINRAAGAFVFEFDFSSSFGQVTARNPGPLA